MFLIIGNILDISNPVFTNRETGEVRQEHSVEVLHKEAGKNVITSLKVDPSVVAEWTKAIGKEFKAEVRPWGMNGKTGMALVDKKSLPTILKPSAMPLAAAA